MPLNHSFRLVHEGADRIAHVILADVAQSYIHIKVWALFHGWRNPVGAISER